MPIPWYSEVQIASINTSPACEKGVRCNDELPGFNQIIILFMEQFLS